MKTANYLMAIAACIICGTSCVENSAKYKEVTAQRDSLLLHSSELEANYNETLDILNQVEETFKSIRETEDGLIVEMNNIEKQPESKKKEIISEVRYIQEKIESNKARLNELEKKLNTSNANNSALRKTIKRLEEELQKSNDMLASLEEDLKNKDIKIEGLSKEIDSLNVNLAELDRETASQKEEMAKQDKLINTVWYCIGKTADLKKAGIISRKSMFSAKKILDGEFDKSSFTETDLRDLKSIEINASKIKLVTQHPSDSYNIVTGDSKNTVLEISDPVKFWSVSKYLVVEI